MPVRLIHRVLAALLHINGRRFPLCLIALAGFAPFSATAATVFVTDPDTGPVDGAEVWVNCALRGVTDWRGTVSTTLTAGDEVVARKVVDVAPSAKGAHPDGWAYRVWHTNVVQHDDGTWSDTLVEANDRDLTVTISAKNAIVGFNLVGSLEYNATPESLAEIGAGFVNASEHLFDVTDGQMLFERFLVYEDNEYFVNADAQFFAHQWPNATVGDRQVVTQPHSHLHLPGGGFRGAWDGRNAARTLVHEFGHYAVGARDEYKNGSFPSSCPAPRPPALPPPAPPPPPEPEETHRASVMFDSANTTEFCHDANHNPRTDQGRLNGMSVWGTLNQNWRDRFVDLQTPMTRGAAHLPPLPAIVNPGPNSVPCMFRTQVRSVPVSTVACPPYRLTARLLGVGAGGVTATLLHDQREIALGVTSSAANIPLGGAWIPGLPPPGSIEVLGGVPGDRVIFSKRSGSGPNNAVSIRGTAIVTDCRDQQIDLRMDHYVAFYPKLIVRIPQHRVDIVVPFADAPQQLENFSVRIGAPGTELRNVSMRWNAEAAQFEGGTDYDPRYGAKFDVSVHATTLDHVELQQVRRFDGALFHPAGPGNGSGAEIAPDHESTGSWELFESDASVQVTVDRQSLDPQTSVTVGDAEPPIGLPPGWAFIAEPRWVTADQILRTFVTLQLRYDPTAACGDEQCEPDAGSVNLVRLRNNRWDKVVMRHDRINRTVTADVVDWGVYAVIARER